MLILGIKRANFDQKESKMGGARFFLDCKHQFSKRRPYDKFLYTKKENSMYLLEDISQNVNFGPKRGKFGPHKGPKMGGARFFQNP